jgi:hypothetical protein
VSHEQEEQDWDTLLGHLDRMATAMESLVEVAMSANNALVTIAEHIDPDGDLPPEFRQSPPYRRVTVDVQLPDADAVSCQRCFTVQPADPLHPGYPAPHQCVEWKGPVGDHDERQQDNAESDSWDENPAAKRLREASEKFDSADRSAAGDGGWSTHITGPPSRHSAGRALDIDPPPGMAYGPGTYDRPSSHSSWSPEPWEMR